MVDMPPSMLLPNSFMTPVRYGSSFPVQQSKIESRNSVMVLAGGSVPMVLAGGSVPMVLAGGSVPMELADGSVPMVLAGWSVPMVLGTGLSPCRIVSQPA